MELYFATSNRNKFKEAQEVLREEIELKHFEFKHREIRSDSIEEIALDSVEAAYAELEKPVFVEDTGLFLHSLEGFPGTYSAWIQKKIGNKGVLKLLEGKNKGAEFRCCVAYCNGKERKTFFGKIEGEISSELKGENGFGYDPVFIPKGYVETFAQSIELKKRLSHRYKAIYALKAYILKEF